MWFTKDFEIEDGVLKKYTGPGGDVVIPDGVTKIGIMAFYYRRDVNRVTIPKSVTRIEGGAFQACTCLYSAVIPKSVTFIGRNAFSGCSSLRSITIPEGLTSIEDAVFYQCSSIRDIEIPDSVTSIGEYAFEDCSSLRNVKIPGSVTYIGEEAFHGCKGLADRNGFVIMEGYPILFDYCGSDQDIVVPGEITSIGNRAFKHCTEIRSVQIPDSVTSIGDDAFYACESLTEVEIPDNVTYIGKDVFQYCLSLEKIICHTSYAMSNADKARNYNLIYLGDSFSELTKNDRKRAVAGFFYALEHGLAGIGRWKESYCRYIKDHVGAFLGEARKNRFIMQFLIKEGLLDEERTALLLEQYRNADDVEIKAALMQYQHEKFGKKAVGDAAGDFDL